MRVSISIPTANELFRLASEAMTVYECHLHFARNGEVRDWVWKQIELCQDNLDTLNEAISEAHRIDAIPLPSSLGEWPTDVVEEPERCGAQWIGGVASRWCNGCTVIAGHGGLHRCRHGVQWSVAGEVVPTEGR